MKNIITSVFIVLLMIPINTFGQQNEEQQLSFGSLDWSPDGSTLIFTAMFVNPDYSNYKPESWQLYRYHMDTEKLNILESSVLFASFAPDGKRIAYGKYLDDNWEIYVKELDGGKTNRLTKNNAKDNAPTWSNDGKRLTFNSDRDGNYEIFVMNADGAGIIQVTKTDTIKNYNPEWSPDGDFIVYYQEKGDDMDQIYLTDSAGSFFKNLTDDQSHNFYPSWTSDNRIVYTTMGTGFFTISTDGTLRSKLDGASGFYIKQLPEKPIFAILKPEEEAIFLYNAQSKEMRKLLDKKDLLRMKD